MAAGDFIPYGVATMPKYSLSQIKDFATNNAESVYPSKEQSTKERDAYRHILWQAMTANQFGQPTANVLGNMHESYIPLVGAPLQPSDQREMDLYNNKLGVQLGLRVKTLPEMMAEAKKIVDTGKAKLDAYDGSY
jgi:hypothetical protein